MTEPVVGQIEPIYTEVAGWMRAQREKHAFSKVAVAKLLGVAPQTYRLMEAAKVRYSLDTYERLRILLDDGRVQETRALLAQQNTDREAPVRKWNAVELGAKLRAQYEAGTGIAALAKKYGYPRRYIVYALTVAGASLRPHQLPPSAILHRDGEIVRLYRQGHRTPDIAAMLDVTEERIKQVLVRA